MMKGHAVDAQTHKILDFLEHLWPYISGIVVTMFAAIRLWWHDRKETKKRIQHLEIMAENMVTHTQLHACREDVRVDDEKNLGKIYTEIKELTKDNAAQHQDIMKQIVRLHGNDKK